MSVIQCSCLGRYGRLGNQLFQYAFTRAYAEQHGADVAFPTDWIGFRIFPNTSPGVALRSLPVVQPADPSGLGVDIDFKGYFDTQPFIDYYTREQVREWFELAHERRLPKERDWYVACHLRWADYLKRPDFYPIVPLESALLAMECRGLDPSRTIWVLEETQEPFPSPGLEWLRDFSVLLQADILFRGNSWGP
jgi:hypothetical protein